MKAKISYTIGCLVKELSRRAVTAQAMENTLSHMNGK